MSFFNKLAKNFFVKNVLYIQIERVSVIHSNMYKYKLFYFFFLVFIANVLFTVRIYSIRTTQFLIDLSQYEYTFNNMIIS